MKTMKQLTASALLLALLASAAACGSSDGKGSVTDAGGQDSTVPETTAVEEEAYPYETPDLGGYALRVLSAGFLWDMYMEVDVTETTGEVLNDAVYNRNRRVEDKLNCTFDETNLEVSDDPGNLNKKLQESIMAGEDLYDVAYAAIYNTPAMVTDGYFRNLLDVEELHLEEAWWDSVVADNATIEDCLFFVTSPMHLMPYDGAWVLFFNETMMEKNDMEKPYDLARSGKWTYDALLDYCKQITNMNGDASFAWDQGGNAIYGISSHGYAADKFIIGAGEYFIEKEQDGTLAFAASGERFFDVLTSLAGIMDENTGYTIFGSNTDYDAATGGYMYVFSVGRSLFLTGEVKAAQQLRDMEDTFGILPYPKYDETQESYYSSFVNQCMFYTIPVTNTHTRETAIISDYTSYMSKRDVLPVYYGNVVEQKGLRNEDSIEMLDLILSTKTVDLGVLFGWTNTLLEAMRTKLFAGSTDLASLVEKQQKNIDKKMSATLETIRDTLENS
ncbi:MAG: extracellular solute-binding protein [Clostridia bacterium]|nr:extracellular solute-binding protein [Clostridia bacterium]